MKKRRWEVWKRPDGSTYLVWGTKRRPVADETLVSTFFSDTWLTAQWEAFAMEPETDEAIEPLMRICELFSGCMTLHACQGHAERDDDCAIIGLAFDDVLCFKAFYEALVNTEAPNLLTWLLRIDDERLLDLPPEALAFELVLAEVDEEDFSDIPNPDDLKQFAKNLLARSGLDGVPTTAWPWQQRGEAN